MYPNIMHLIYKCIYLNTISLHLWLLGALMYVTKMISLRLMVLNQSCDFDTNVTREQRNNITTPF